MTTNTQKTTKKLIVEMFKALSYRLKILERSASNPQKRNNAKDNIDILELIGLHPSPEKAVTDDFVKAFVNYRRKTLSTTTFPRHLSRQNRPEFDIDAYLRFQIDILRQPKKELKEMLKNLMSIGICIEKTTPEDFVIQSINTTVNLGVATIDKINKDNKILLRASMIQLRRKAKNAFNVAASLVNDAKNDPDCEVAIRWMSAKLSQEITGIDLNSNETANRFLAKLMEVADLAFLEEIDTKDSFLQLSLANEFLETNIGMMSDNPRRFNTARKKLLDNIDAAEKTLERGEPSARNTSREKLDKSRKALNEPKKTVRILYAHAVLKRVIAANLLSP